MSCFEYTSVNPNIATYRICFVVEVECKFRVAIFLIVSTIITYMVAFGLYRHTGTVELKKDIMIINKGKHKKIINFIKKVVCYGMSIRKCKMCI